MQVTTATLVIAASSPSMTYGAAVPTITPSYSGFVNGDNAASLTTAPTCSTTATSSSPVGSYPDSCSQASDPNYAITYVPGTTVVGSAALVVRASSGTMTYGGSAPTITPIVLGLRERGQRRLAVACSRRARTTAIGLAACRQLRQLVLGSGRLELHHQLRDGVGHRSARRRSPSRPRRAR